MNVNYAYKQSLKWPWYKQITFGVTILLVYIVYIVYIVYMFSQKSISLRRATFPTAQP